MMVFTLDVAGGAEVLKELAAQTIEELAQQVAARAGEGALVEMSVSDRARARVKVPADAQAKDGVLSRAASEAGLAVVQFKRKPRKPNESGAPRKRGRPRKKSA